MSGGKCPGGTCPGGVLSCHRFGCFKGKPSVIKVVTMVYPQWTSFSVVLIQLLL